MLLSQISLSATTDSTKEKTMIIPIKQIKNVLPHVNQETLVVFDIDKTLLQAKTKPKLCSFRVNHSTPYVASSYAQVILLPY